MKGLIIKAISGEYSVLIDDKVIICKPLGVFRLHNITPKVGDIATIKDNTIISLDKRKNDFIRPFVCNVNKVFIVTSIVEPDLNLNLLDKIICQSEYSDLEIILIFSKEDLVDINKFQNIFYYYAQLGYKVYIAPRDKDLIKEEINNSICVLAGQSGVGKSSLVNLLDKNFNIKTDEISYALNRGKHTTRHTELLRVNNGFIADTPGFGLLDLDMDENTLSQVFKEFFSTKCKYNGCLHVKEPGCKVKEKVEQGIILKSRYENYLDFYNEIINRKKKY